MAPLKMHEWKCAMTLLLPRYVAMDLICQMTKSVKGLLESVYGK